MYTKQVGITGTREPTGAKPAEALRAFLKAHPEITALHHGACEGADAMSHYIALECRRRVIVHPPLDTRYMATGLIDNYSTWFYRPFPYRKRNQHIVDQSDLLIAFPLLPEDHPDSKRSGTWQTVRMAREKGIPIWIVKPDGEMVPDV